MILNAKLIRHIFFLLIQNGLKYGKCGDKNSKTLKVIEKIIIVLRLKVMHDMVNIIRIVRLIFRKEKLNRRKKL